MTSTHNYLVRVELHNASKLDYNALHAAMERSGFSRTILANNGVRYHLPTAEYVIASAAGNSQGVFSAAQAAANSTGRSSSVIAAEYLTSTFDLPPA